MKKHLLRTVLRSGGTTLIVSAINTWAASAFTGPSQSGGTGSGAIGIDSSGDIRKGFTVLELLIYIALFSVLIVAFITMLTAVTNVQTQQGSTLEVNTQSQAVLQDIQYYTELSSVIDMPQDVATTTLTLRMANSSTDPTVFTLQGGQMFIKQGNGAQTAVTSNRVNVTNLSFTKRSNAPSHDSVSVAFTVSYNTSNVQQMFSQMLQTSIARVSAATFDSSLIPSSTNYWSLGQTGNIWNSINSIIYFNGNNVGVGTASPSFPLVVNGTTSALAYCLSGVNCITAWPGNLWNASGTNIYNTNSGSVSIGTTTPSDILDVRTPTTVNQVGITISAPGNGGGGSQPALTFKRYTGPTVNTVARIFSGGCDTGSPTCGDLYFQTGSSTTPTTAMRIDQNGYVGIGTASPGAKLEISDTAGNSTVLLGNRNYYAAKNASGASVRIAGVDQNNTVYLGGIDAAGNTVIRQNGSDVITINGGNVGIGTTGPGAPLEVNGSVGANPTLIVRNSSYNSTNSAGTNTLLFDWANHGGAEIQASKVSTNVTNLLFYGELGFNNPSLIMTMQPGSAGGLIWRATNSAYFDTTSDVRLKTNIQTIDNSLGLLERLRGVTFNWKDPSRGSGTQMGFIAQELQPVFPQWVHTGSDGYLSINPSGIDALLVDGINEEDAKVQKLESDNTALNYDNAALRSDDAQLKAWTCSQPNKPAFCR